MYLKQWVYTLILALSLIGAPFGMGRMMDDAHASSSMQASHGAHHQTAPEHSGATPHYVVCAACVAADTLGATTFIILVPENGLDATEQAALAGLPVLPPVPPPISLILTV